jgi:pimeloyl-ACP methyl ester carboxylesterase
MTSQPADPRPSAASAADAAAALDVRVVVVGRQPLRVAVRPGVPTRTPLLLVNGIAAGAGWTSLPLLPWLRQPTLLLAGDDDPIIPLVNARLMRRLLPDAELHVYHGGHLGLLTEAGELALVVDRFLRRAPS